MFVICAVKYRQQTHSQFSENSISVQCPPFTFPLCPVSM